MNSFINYDEEMMPRQEAQQITPVLMQSIYKQQVPDISYFNQDNEEILKKQITNNFPQLMYTPKTYERTNELDLTLQIPINKISDIIKPSPLPSQAQPQAPPQPSPKQSITFDYINQSINKQLSCDNNQGSNSSHTTSNTNNNINNIIFQNVCQQFNQLQELYNKLENENYKLIIEKKNNERNIFNLTNDIEKLKEINKELNEKLNNLIVKENQQSTPQPLSPPQHHQLPSSSCNKENKNLSPIQVNNDQEILFSNLINKENNSLYNNSNYNNTISSYNSDKSNIINQLEMSASSIVYMKKYNLLDITKTSGNINIMNSNESSSYYHVVDDTSQLLDVSTIKKQPKLI